VKQLNIIYFLTILLIFQVNCTHKLEREVIPPDNLIPRNEMVDLIVDMKIYDAIVKAKQKKTPSEVDFAKYYIHNSILEKYDITRERFESSLAYYHQDLEVMDDIYADVITKLSKMKSEVE